MKLKVQKICELPLSHRGVCVCVFCACVLFIPEPHMQTQRPSISIRVTMSSPTCTRLTTSFDLPYHSGNETDQSQFLRITIYTPSPSTCVHSCSLSLQLHSRCALPPTLPAPRPPFPAPKPHIIHAGNKNTPSAIAFSNTAAPCSWSQSSRAPHTRHTSL